MKTNLIGIHTMSYSTEMINFANTGRYLTVPMICYKINDGPVKTFLVNRPIEIFHEHMDYKIIRNIFNKEENDTKFLSIPSKSYLKMQQYVNQSVNKVIADMITYVVVDVLKELKKEDEKAKNIFFIDNVDTNKVIGRLGYLYLEEDNTTIAFVTHKAKGLMTDVLNEGNDQLEFDINYFKSEERKEKEYSEIIPNDYMESLTQTVFFKISAREDTLSPLRCDILTQGISKSKIQSKVNDIYDILNKHENMTVPYAEKSANKLYDNWVMIPVVLNDCIQASEIHKNQVQAILEEAIHG